MNNFGVVHGPRNGFKVTPWDIVGKRLTKRRIDKTNPGTTDLHVPGQELSSSIFCVATVVRQLF